MGGCCPWRWWGLLCLCGEIIAAVCRMEFKGFLGRFPKDPLEHIFSLVVIPLVVCYVRWWLHIGMDMAMCAPTGWGGEQNQPQHTKRVSPAATAITPKEDEDGGWGKKRYIRRSSVARSADEDMLRACCCCWGLLWGGPVICVPIINVHVGWVMLVVRWSLLGVVVAVAGCWCAWPLNRDASVRWVEATAVEHMQSRGLCALVCSVTCLYKGSCCCSGWYWRPTRVEIGTGGSFYI